VIREEVVDGTTGRPTSDDIFQKKNESEATLSWFNHLMRRWQCLRNSPERDWYYETSSRRVSVVQMQSKVDCEIAERIGVSASVGKPIGGTDPMG
jgi:hypothetical protein